MAKESDMIGGYRLRKLLHRAQYSQVFEVIEPRSNRHFAMKILLPEYAGDATQRRMLFHEARVGQEMRHDNVVNIIKVSTDPKTPHFIMEYFPAGSLRSRLQSREAEDKAYLYQHAKSIFRQVATGLAYMNSSGWLHRDIKPDNILADANGNCKIIDFAIAQKIKSGFLAKLLHKKGKPQGTPSYMSPEQIRDEILDTRADIYSYGATLYELLCGRPPFRASTTNELLSKHLHAAPDPPKMHNPDITDACSALVLKMLAKKREDRFQNFHEILMALREISPFSTTQPSRMSGES
jgi:serine/threonine protein kinase